MSCPSILLILQDDLSSDENVADELKADFIDEGTDTAPKYETTHGVYSPAVYLSDVQLSVITLQESQHVKETESSQE